MAPKKRLLVHLHRPDVKKLSTLHSSMRQIHATRVPAAQLEALKIVIDGMYFNINGICEKLDDIDNNEGVRTMDMILKLKKRLDLLNVQMVPRERPKDMSFKDRTDVLLEGLPSILNIQPSPMAAHNIGNKNLFGTNQNSVLSDLLKTPGVFRFLPTTEKLRYIPKHGLGNINFADVEAKLMERNSDAFMDAARKAADQMLSDMLNGNLKPFPEYLENIFAKGSAVHGTSQIVGETSPKVEPSPKVGEPIKGKLTCMAMERLKAGLEQKQSEMVNADNKSGYEAIQALLDVLDKTF